MHDQSPPARLVHSIAETAQLLGGISVRGVYNLLGSGALKSIHIGGRNLVTHESIVALVTAASEAGK
jgi:hypothetical protein